MTTTLEIMPKKPTIPGKAYSYVRFSTPEQSKGDSYRRQTSAAAEYAKRHKLTLDDSLSLKDLGISAYRGANLAPDAALGRFLRAVEDGVVPPGSYLLLENLDRFSRQNAWDALDRLRPIIKAGIHVVTLQDGQKYDKESLTNEPWSLVMAIMSLSRAHDESRRKGQRLKEAWNQKREVAKTGKVISRKIPSWLAVAANGKIEVIPERGRLIKEIFKRTLAGVGRGSLAKDFNKRKIKPWGDGPKGSRKGEYWQSSYIAKILRNSAVVGTYTPHSVESNIDTGIKTRKPEGEIPGYFPRVIPDETYRSVQRLIEIRDTRRGSHAAKGVSSIFAGLAKCPKCGNTMTRVTKGPSGGAPYLVCTKAKLGAGCQYRALKLPIVSSALLSGLPEVLGNFPGPNRESEREIRRLEIELEEESQTLKLIVDDYASRPSPIIRKKIDEIESLISKKTDRLNTMRDERAEKTGPWIDRDLKKLYSLVESKKPDHQSINLSLRSLTKSITMDYVNGHMVILWKHGGESKITFGFPQEDEELRS